MTPADGDRPRPRKSGAPQARRASSPGGKGKGTSASSSSSRSSSSSGRPFRPRSAEREQPRTGRPSRARREDDAGIGSEARRAVARGRGRANDPKGKARDDAKDRGIPPVRKGWGGVARRGARNLEGPRDATASKAWRDAVDRDRARPAEWEPEVWIEEPDAGAGRVTPASAPPPRTVRRPREPKLPTPVKEELGKANRKLAPKLEQRLADAVRAYERDRYQDARRILRPLAESTPDAAAIRELYGLTLYRMNRWAEALKELEAFHALTGSHDQHPVLMDASRALRRWKRVEALWQDLKEASPGADIMAEGRIVAAGALADRGRLAEGIRLLERAPNDVKRPKLHHLRTWYALADLYERAGELPRARTLFSTVLRHDHEFADVAERLAALG